MTEEFKNDIWRDVVGYEGLYKVSNLGRIKSTRFYKKKGIYVERIITPQKEWCGHLHIVLYKNGKGKHQKVHRLVAMAFLPNPHKFPCINHKDENKQNNYICVNADGSVDFEKSNLEWSTAKYNCNYGTRNQRLSAKNKNNSFRSKPVEQYDLKGRYISEYPSVMEAGRILNLRPDGIDLCCNCKYMTCGGFQWKFKNSNKVISNVDTKVIQYNKKGEMLALYKNAKDASLASKVSHSSILNCLCGLSKSAGGFIWKKEICK